MLQVVLLICCLNQFTVTVEKPLQPFTVEVEKPKAVDEKPYVVMFSASWCGPCRNYKESGKLDKIVASGVRVTVIDIDSDSSYYSGRIPKFWICKNKIRIHEFPEGTIEPDTILRKIREMDKPPDKKTTRSNIYNGRPNNSHTDRESLINHLLNESIHKGRHQKEALESMSDVELDSLHSLDHNTR